MKQLKGIMLLTLLAFVVSACAKIDYVGESFPQTEKVDIYFSEEDVQDEFKIMGHMIATAGDFVSAQKMQKKMIKTARENGADGIIILGLERYQSGESTNYHETSVKKKGKTKVSGSSSTSTSEKKEIKATLIKYI